MNIADIQDVVTMNMADIQDVVIEKLKGIFDNGVLDPNEAPNEGAELPDDGEDEIDEAEEVHVVEERVYFDPGSRLLVRM